MSLFAGLGHYTFVPDQAIRRLVIMQMGRKKSHSSCPHAGSVLNKRCTVRFDSPFPAQREMPSIVTCQVIASIASATRHSWRIVVHPGLVPNRLKA
jgi:hypothetical protein